MFCDSFGNIYIGMMITKRELESVIDLLEFHYKRNDLNTDQAKAYQYLKGFYMQLEGDSNIQLKSYIDR